MNEAIRALQPTELWNHFADINAIPRASKKEEKIIEFIKSFGENLHLDTHVDEVGNVIIKKPASKGMENRVVVCLQSHLDMVHQKNETTNFDFDKDGIDMLIENNWVTANGTTLGADNGIGVATILSILASTTIEHPPIEALFTIDEETGMTGAMGLKGGLLDAQILLNLDTEEDNELTIGCAGGIDITASGEYETATVDSSFEFYKVSLKGLTGGHSGIDIHKGRANANKLMNRFLILANEKFGIQVQSIDGGSLRNAIPRESFSVIAIEANQYAAFTLFVQEMAEIFKAEYKTTDSNLNLTIQSYSTGNEVINSKFTLQLLQTIYACPNGIYRMSPDIKDLVQSSNNLSRVLVQDGKYSIQCLTRSSVETEKMDLALAIKSTFSLLHANIVYGGSYPGWQARPEAGIVKMMTALYSTLHEGEIPLVNACHAGLECGILGTNYPQMEMISFGPTIHGAHSPDEKVSIASVEKFWAYLLETLKSIPVAAL